MLTSGFFMRKKKHRAGLPASRQWPLDAVRPGYERKKGNRKWRKETYKLSFLRFSFRFFVGITKNKRVSLLCQQVILL